MVSFMSTRWANLVTDPSAKVGQEDSDPARLRQVFDVVRAGLMALGDFPPEAIAETHEIGAEAARPVRDGSAVPFLTIAPQGARDVDQAIHVERAGHGYRVPVAIAIADIAAVVRPGGELDLESCRRGQAVHLGGDLHLLGGEAATMGHLVGETLRGSVVDITQHRTLVQISDPATLAPVVGECSAGAEVTVRLTVADLARGSELFQMVGE
jgi:RNB domain/RNase II-type exonuclease C-terminal S1 domain